MKRAKGFTLMELMVVIVIVAILAAVAVPLYINYVKDAQRTEAADLTEPALAVQADHVADRGRRPARCDLLPMAAVRPRQPAQNPRLQQRRQALHRAIARNHMPRARRAVRQPVTMHPRPSSPGGHGLAARPTRGPANHPAARHAAASQVPHQTAR